MKRTVKNFIALFFAAFMCVCGSTSAFALGHGKKYEMVNYFYAPEGTAFADLLVKDKKSGKYSVDFNAENAERLNVGADCGLAKYDEDGYTSLLLRHNCAEYDDSAWDSIMYSLKVENHKMYNQFEKVKLAYCDENGDIIEVTNEVELQFVFFRAPVIYCFSAEGNVLSFSLSDTNWTEKVEYVCFGAVATGCILIVMFIIVLIGRKISHKKEKVQAGEVDNERKE
jgi:hypothetical protein